MLTAHTMGKLSLLLKYDKIKSMLGRKQTHTPCTVNFKTEFLVIFTIIINHKIVQTAAVRMTAPSFLTRHNA